LGKNFYIRPNIGPAAAGPAAAALRQLLVTRHQQQLQNDLAYNDCMLSNAELL